jgi:hypothetical protein
MILGRDYGTSFSGRVGHPLNGITTRGFQVRWVNWRANWTGRTAAAAAAAAER